jgi:hypothetical protein
MPLNVLNSWSSGEANGNNTVSGSFTPTANSRIFVAVMIQRDTHTQPEDWSISGGSLTWNAHAESLDYDFASDTGYAGSIKSWWADVGGTPASMTVTADARQSDASNVHFYSGLAFEITDFDTDTPFPQAAVVSGAVVNPVNSAQSATLTLGSAPTNGNYVIGLFGTGANSTGAPTTPTGFTLIGAGQSQRWTKINGFYRTDTTTPGITCPDLGTDIGQWAGIAFEVAKVGGGPPPSDFLPLRRKQRLVIHR